MGQIGSYKGVKRDFANADGARWFNAIVYGEILTRTSRNQKRFDAGSWILDPGCMVLNF